MKICSKLQTWNTMPVFFCSHHIIHLVSAHALFKPRIQCVGSFWMMIWCTQHNVYCTYILCLHTNLVHYTINRVHDMRNFRCLNIFHTLVRAKIEPTTLITFWAKFQWQFVFHLRTKKHMLYWHWIQPTQLWLFAV